MEIKSFSDDRAVLNMNDEGARARLVDRGSLKIPGVQLFFAPWRSEVNTFQEEFFEKEER